MDNEFYTYAVEYINKGYKVFPLQPKGKTPLTRHGLKDASDDPAQIKAWWQAWPDANIAIATGQASGGLYVIDMDAHDQSGVNGFDSVKEWQRMHGNFPKSKMSKTGGDGYHYFFHDTHEHKNQAAIIPAVDFRGDGGYIVAPPSIHESGKTYKWIEKTDGFEIAEIDDNIRYFLQHDKDLPTQHFVSPDKIPQGERNDMLFKCACMMQAKGMSDEAVFASTMAENNAKCTEPLEESEIRNIVNGVLRNYEKGKPIYFDSLNVATQGAHEPRFQLTDKGKIRKTWDNIREAIEFDEKLYGSIRYNVMANSIFVYGALPWEIIETYRPWRNSDDANLKAYLEKRYSFDQSEKIMDALTVVADRHRFNPVTEMLQQIHAEYPSNAGAIRSLLVDYMGVVDNDYNYEVMKVYMLGAICRAFYPGCKFDYTLILYGKQGFGKSEFLRKLALNNEWYNDNFSTVDGDKAIEKLSGMWIIEMAELKALKSSKDAESFKAFLTSQTDTYRAPYSRRAEQRPRMCVFSGTTNNMNVFTDKTGNRRFLPVITRAGYNTKSLFDTDQDSVERDFRRAWAEAMDLFEKADKHPILRLPEEAERYADSMRDEFSEDDYRVGVIQKWLDETDAKKVCVPQIIEYALMDDITKMSKQAKREIGDILEHEIVGWSRLRNKDKGRSYCGKYGKQVAFIKDSG